MKSFAQELEDHYWEQAFTAARVMQLFRDTEVEAPRKPTGILPLPKTPTRDEILAEVRRLAMKRD